MQTQCDTVLNTYRSYKDKLSKINLSRDQLVDEGTKQLKKSDFVESIRKIDFGLCGSLVLSFPSLQ